MLTVIAWKLCYPDGLRTNMVVRTRGVLTGVYAGDAEEDQLMIDFRHGRHKQGPCRRGHKYGGLR